MVTSPSLYSAKTEPPNIHRAAIIAASPSIENARIREERHSFCLKPRMFIDVIGSGEPENIRFEGPAWEASMSVNPVCRRRPNFDSRPVATLYKDYAKRL